MSDSETATPEPSSVRRFIGKSSGRRRDSFVYGDVEFVFEADPDGDLYMGVMFPNPEDALNAGKHAARTNGRQTAKGELRPYPIEIYGDVVAILNTYRMPDGEPPLDINEAYSLYDTAPELFSLMRGAAIEVVGVGGGETRPNSGLASWSAVFSTAARAHRMVGEVATGSVTVKADDLRAVIGDIFRLAKAAIGDYKLNARDVAGEGVALDPELEAILGN